MVFLGSTYEVGGPSTTAPKLPFPVGRPFSVVADSIAVHHEEIGGLGYRVENLEHAHGMLVRKMGEVSDAQVDDNIAIGEIQPKVTTLEGRVEVLGNQHDLMVNKIVEVEDQVLKIHDKEDTHPCEKELGHANNTNEVRQLLGLTGYYQRFASPEVESGNGEDSSPKIEDGNGRLSIPIIGLKAVL
ncbi:hypothetical protein Tco_0132815 [Tanacetum coccineum]